MKKLLMLLVLVPAVLGMVQAGAQTESQQQPSGQAAPAGPTIKDPAEYNAYVTALNQSDPAAKAQALDTFLQQYPNSVVKVSALELLMATHQQLGNSQKVVDTASRLLQVEPNNLRALALLTYIYRQQAEAGGANAAQSLQQAAQYAQKGMQAIASAQKPPESTAADWEKLKAQTQAIFAGAAGMAALQQKDYPNAQKYLEIAVKAQPSDLRNVYPLALAYLQQKPQDPRGLWYIARAASLAGGSPAQAQITAYGKRAYTVYHGGDDGWDQLLAQAKASPDPPAGFAVKPAPTPAEQAANLANTKPVEQMSFDEFKLILTSGNQQAADKVWTGIKGKPIAFEGKVIGTTKNSLMLAATVDDIQSNQADVEVTFESPIAASLMPKQAAMVKIEGTPVSFDANPFMIHMGKGAFIGAPPPKKAAPARKTPARRKPPQ
jgi:tetratricopeptide (TPR) repeat protein